MQIRVKHRDSDATVPVDVKMSETIRDVRNRARDALKLDTNTRWYIKYHGSQMDNGKEISTTCINDGDVLFIEPMAGPVSPARRAP